MNVLHASSHAEVLKHPKAHCNIAGCSVQYLRDGTGYVVHLIESGKERSYAAAPCLCIKVQPYYWASEPSRYVGAVFGLLGAKTVCDIRHQPLTMLHKRKTETTSCKTAPGSDLPPECQTLYRPWRQSLDQVDCAFHIVCAGAACLMPTHPW